MELGKKYSQNLNTHTNKDISKSGSFIGKKNYFDAFVYSVINKILGLYLDERVLRNTKIAFIFGEELEVTIKLKDKFEGINLQMQKEEIQEKILSILSDKNILIKKVLIKIMLN